MVPDKIKEVGGGKPIEIWKEREKGDNNNDTRKSATTADTHRIRRDKFSEQRDKFENPKASEKGKQEESDNKNGTRKSSLTAEISLHLSAEKFSEQRDKFENPKAFEIGKQEVDTAMMKVGHVSDKQTYYDGLDEKEIKESDNKNGTRKSSSTAEIGLHLSAEKFSEQRDKFENPKAFEIGKQEVDTAMMKVGHVSDMQTYYDDLDEKEIKRIEELQRIRGKGFGGKIHELMEGARRYYRS